MKRILVGAATAVVLVAIPAAPASAHATHFKNCTAMHHKYRHGVGRVHAHDHVRGSTKPVTTFKRSDALYAANKSMDRDHDGVACEAR